MTFVLVKSVETFGELFRTFVVLEWSKNCVLFADLVVHDIRLPLPPFSLVCFLLPAYRCSCLIYSLCFLVSGFVFCEETWIDPPGTGPTARLERSCRMIYAVNANN